MADPNTKTIKIVNSLHADEPEPLEGGASEQPKKRATRKKKFIIQSVTVQKEGGGSTSPGTISQLASTHVPGSDDTKTTGVVSKLTEAGATVGPIAPSVGGSALKPHQRVVLAKSKKKSSVILAGPKAVVPELKHKKTVKKLNVNLRGLTRKVRKAKNIESKVTGTSVADVKSALVKAGLIKADTKAPESVLRQIYSDFMVLKNKAL
uniref:Uncharacterized protein n=1 Tax=viral metagenome TaxID=1070528 RepID=A0A6C0JXN3_9ZZZZ